MDQHSSGNRNLIPVLIACLLLAGIPPAMAADETAQPPVGGTITIVSFPPGAAVHLNGEYRGLTPQRLRNVSPGEYLINVSLAGYRSETFTVIINHGSTREIGVNLENATASLPPGGSGSIAIDSDPGGASVTLDGTPVGKTPAGRAALILNNVPAGIHTVTAELAGYPPYSRTVTVVKNQVVKVEADFVTESPAVTTIPATLATTGTLPATTPRGQPVPLPPLAAIAAAGIAGLAAVFRRS